MFGTTVMHLVAILVFFFISVVSCDIELQPLDNFIKDVSQSLTGMISLPESNDGMYMSHRS